MTSQFYCKGTLTCSSQSPSGTCKKAPVTYTCEAANSGSSQYEYGCFSMLYSTAKESCERISGQPNVYSAYTSLTCPTARVCCRKPKSGGGGGGGNNLPPVSGGGIQCSALNQCPNSSQKYVEGTITTSSGSLTMYYSSAANCTNNTAAKHTVNEVCYSAGSTAISCTTGDTTKKYYVKFVSGSANIYSDAGYSNNVGSFTATGIASYCTGSGSPPPVVNPPQSFVAEGTCENKDSIISFGNCTLNVYKGTVTNLW